MEEENVIPSIIMPATLFDLLANVGLAVVGLDVGLAVTGLDVGLAVVGALVVPFADFRILEDPSADAS